MNIWKHFTRQVDLHPFGIAVTDGQQSLTYHELYQEVVQLNHTIFKKLSPNKETILLMNSKCNATIVFQLLASASHNVFMPIDPNTPPAQLDWVLRNILPSWIISDEKTSLYYKGYHLFKPYKNVLLWHKDDHTPALIPPNTTHIFMSSGITGSPKCIYLNDYPLCQVVLQQAKLLDIHHHHIFGWILNTSFDASLSDIYATLLSGACLAIYTGKITHIKQLQSFYVERSVTHSDIPPSILGMLDPRKIPLLKTVVIGGEMADLKSVMRWMNDECLLWNSYGPTEATVCTTFCSIGPTWTPNFLGQPLQGVHLFFKKNNGFSSIQPYESGELFIGGSHLAIGYHNHDLTDKTFIQTSHGILYKTGDMVSVDASGSLLFHGRSDRQFKHHGILVQPEAIEIAALAIGCSFAQCHYINQKIHLYFSADMDHATITAQLTPLLPTALLPHHFHNVTPTLNSHHKRGYTQEL